MKEEHENGQQEEQKRGERNVFDCEEFLQSPILRTTILFWACYLDETMISWRDIRDMIEELKAFPEGRNKMDVGKTALHAASIAGNWKKLRVLLTDVNQRYQCAEEQKRLMQEGSVAWSNSTGDKNQVGVSEPACAAAAR